MAKRNDIFSIKLTNWNKYNANRKKSFRCVMISERFLDDAKVASLSPTTRLLFLACILASAESTRGQHEVNPESHRGQPEVNSRSTRGHCEVTAESLARQSGVKLGSLEGQLTLLESLQLLTYQKIDVLYEMKGNEKKRNEKKRSNDEPKKTAASGELVPAGPADAAKPKGANEFIAAYCERFKRRWGMNPPIQPKDAGIAGRLAKGLTPERRDLYLDAYFAMPDAALVKAKHPINLFELKLNEVSVFAESGEFTTARQARQADDSATNALLLERVRRGEL